MSNTHFNILIDPAFPVVTASGAKDWMSFSQIMDETGDFAIAFDWPRADFNVASMELCIGMLSLVYKPARSNDWLDLWHVKTPIDLQARIDVLKPYFKLFGDEKGEGPRFCQDLEPLDGEENPIEGILIDTPGVNGQKKNADLLTHRDRFPALGVKAAAIALYALQQFAPAGGAGNRTSMRGGGPMTTLVVPMRDEGPLPLARMLLANLPVRSDPPDDADLARVLPWLKPTLTSEGKPGREIADADPAVHPAQTFFGMPRRIRLVARGEGICPMTGEEGPLVTGFIQKPWGMNYSVWRHPLTPYRQAKDDPAYTVKPKAARLGYRDWVGITVGRADKGNQALPAEVVKAALNGPFRGVFRHSKLRLLAAGWSMSNMEAETYLYSLQPLYFAEEPPTAARIADEARAFADSAERVVSLLRKALNDALFSGQAKSTDAGMFAEAADAFFAETENAFHDHLREIADGHASESEASAKRWLKTMRQAALRIYDARTAHLLANPGRFNRVRTVVDGCRRLSAQLQETGMIAADLGIAQPSQPKSRNKPAKGGVA